MAANVGLTPDARSAIALVFQTLVDSWNKHDMVAFAAQFAEDADFVNVIGMHWHGRHEIEARHVEVHRTIFRDSSLRMLDFSLRPLAAGLVLGHMKWEMTGHESRPRELFSELRNGLISAVFVQQDGRWLIASFHNTDIVPMPASGPTK
jgi:uncharacterized protein (TIGR02246 family)